MEIDFAVLADAATVDATGKLNVLGIFDRIHAQDFPVRHGRISLVFRFAAGVQELGAHEITIRLSSPDGKEMIKLDGRMDLAGGARGVAEGIKIPHILNLDGLVFPREGRYNFEIQVDGSSLHSLSLVLDRAGPGQPASGGAGRIGSGWSPQSPFAFGAGGGAEA